MSVLPISVAAPPDADPALVHACSDAQRGRALARHALAARAIEIRDRAQAAGDNVRRALLAWLSSPECAGLVSGPVNVGPVSDRSTVGPVSRPVSLRTLYNWMSQAASGALPAVDRRGGPRRGVDVSDAAWQRFKQLYLTESRDSLVTCWRIVAAEASRGGWTWLSYDALRRRVARELPPAVADRFRVGERRWKAKHLPRIVCDPARWRANEHWLGDHHQFDLWALSERCDRPVRPFLTAWLDRRSRVLVGWRIVESPSSDSIALALRDAVERHGAPLHVTIDNGRDYRCAGLSGGRVRVRHDRPRFDSLFARLGIQPHWAGAFNPQSKGAIERYFGTVCGQFARRLPSYCGAAPSTRPEPLARDLKAGDVSLPTLDELRAMFHEWVEKDYHRAPHGGAGMDGRAPLAALSECDPIARRGVPAALLDWFCLSSARAKVTRHGVTLRGVRYGHSQGDLLLPLQGREMTLRYDPRDASRVHLCEEDGRHVATLTNALLCDTTTEDLRAALKQRKRIARQVRAVADLPRPHSRTIEHAAQEIAALARSRGPGQSGNCGTDLPTGQTGQSGTGRPLRLLEGAGDASPPPFVAIDPPPLVSLESIADAGDALALRESEIDRGLPDLCGSGFQPESDCGSGLQPEPSFLDVFGETP